MSKKFKLVISLFLLLSIFFSHIVQATTSKENIDNSISCSTIEFFFSVGCPHCAKAYDYLKILETEYPEIKIIRRDVYADAENRDRFIEFNKQFGIEQPGVPSFLICDQYLIGFDNERISGAMIKQMLGLNNSETTLSKNQLDLPVLGKISVEKAGLPTFTIAIGLVDGFNPCAMWVLLILLSILVNLRNRKRIILIAGTFVFISGAVYFIFMTAWLNIFLIIGFSRILQIIVGLIAILIGSIHIKDYFSFKKGLSLSIPDSKKPSLYIHIRNIIYAKNLIATFIAVVIMAILVNMIELLCTAGLPAIYTQILTLQDLNTSEYYLYLVLYNIAYMFDDALMVGIVVFTLSKRKMEEQHGRWLKLLSGSVIFLLGLLLILKPSLLI
ncbi:MAG: NrdH-redoxin [Proteobacteria bacterium]|nr:NrdH-redoxin [Pseudomonadota bacterium]